jgi:hypothetical protein
VQFVFFVILLVAMFVCDIIEHFIPPVAGIGARVFLMPLVVMYGSVALPLWGMLGLVFVAGGIADLQHVQMVEGTPEIGLGWSIVLYGVIGTIMAGFRPLYQRGRWELHCVLCGLCTSFIPLAEYLMISIRRQPVHFQFTPDIWWRIGGAGLAAMFLSPFFFFGFNYIAYLVGYDPSPEEEPLDL